MKNLLTSKKIRQMKLGILGASVGFATAACHGLAESQEALHNQDLLERFSRSANAVCVKSSIGIAALDRAEVHASGNADIAGDVLLADLSPAHFSGNTRVRGTVFAEEAGLLKTSGNGKVDGGVTIKSLWSERDLLSKFAGEISKLEPSLKLNSISSHGVIDGVDGVNVIEVAGDIHLSGNQKVTLKGSEKAVFIVNVRGNVHISGNGAIEVAGGVREQNVIFNAVGSGATLKLSGNGVTSGTFLAADRGAHVSGNGVLKGAVIASKSIAISGNGLTLKPQAFCIDVSAPNDGGDQGDEQGEDNSSDPTPTPTETVEPEPTPTETVNPEPTPTSTVTPEPSPMPCTDLVCGGGVIGL